MSYFKDGKVEHEGRIIRFPKEEAAGFESNGDYWHGEGDPSTWLAVTILRECHRRVQPAETKNGIDLAYALAAQVLGISVEAVQQRVDWHENYMRWHDGDSGYSVF